MNNKPIFVTQPYLPPLAEFVPYLEEIWESKVLTNGGKMHQQLEAELAHYLGVEHIALFCNATVALVTALQSLRITGEVITTPYSFVATAHSLLWNGIKPIFVDIDELTLNIDATRIESAITPKTTAIMPVHVYGQPCNVDLIQEIADKYNLKVIYDAAHAFAVRYKDKSVLSFGDLSILSFHATKVFNTFEGGAIICPDAKTKQRIDRLKNFGIVDEVTVVAPGINGKMSEINAAFGLLQLRHIDSAIHARKQIAQIYRDHLTDVAGIAMLAEQIEVAPNYAYFPIMVKEDFSMTRDELYFGLREIGVHTRRYFYPLISDFPMYRGQTTSWSKLPVATRAASQILCLPIYPTLTLEDQFRVIDFIKAR